MHLLLDSLISSGTKSEFVNDFPSEKTILKPLVHNKTNNYAPLNIPSQLRSK